MSSELQERAKRHLWMYFTRMGSYADHEVPVIARGDGCYVYDEYGKRYLDGLSALYCVNIGHGRAEIGEAAARQDAELGFYTNWSYAHPRSIELAARTAELAPGNLNRVFFTSGGSEAIEFEEPATVAAVILEPVQNGGGCFVPQEGYFQRVREICDRHGVLLISDEVICSWGRIGHWFGSERYGYEPDMITTAKGLTS